jgi:hypothetical protein
MNKSTFFSGQPIFTQLLKLLPRKIIAQSSLEFSSDRYYKKFDTYHHLITMLYACYQQCTSIREVTSGLQACQGRLQSLGLRHLTTRSTLSDANKNRSYRVFENIYNKLYYRYRDFLPDSPKNIHDKNLIIIDSTTISLFKEILEGAGMRGNSGKKKGGIKVHTAMYAHEDVPYFIDMTKASQADVTFLKKLEIPEHSIVVMDRGYNNFNKLHDWSNENIDWVTRRREKYVIEVKKYNKVTVEQKAQGIISDKIIVMGTKNKIIQQVNCRLIRYYDKEKNREFEFITNNFEWDALKVAELYKQRWQIELLFKRLKQNMPLQYFLGDNENAIKIQIYCALIADLILKMALSGVKRRWAFSNITSIVRLHLMNYTHLYKFLENPDKCRISNPIASVQEPQLKLFLSG